VFTSLDGDSKREAFGGGDVVEEMEISMTPFSGLFKR